MNEILISVISVVVTSVVLPLITFVGIKLTQWLNTKIKDEKAKTILSSITKIITSNVSAVFQVYVESLKKEGKFDLEEQNMALSLATKQIIGELKEDTKEFISSNYGDITTWVVTQIEATIYDLKNGRIPNN